MVPRPGVSTDAGRVRPAIRSTVHFAMANDFISSVSPVGASGEASVDARFSWGDAFQKYSYFGVLALAAVLLYSYWNMLVGTGAYWDDDQYSHGFLIPLIALYLMWSMRPNPAAQQPQEGQEEESFLGLMPASQMLKVATGVIAAAAVGAYFLRGMLPGGGEESGWLINQTNGVALAVFSLVALGYVMIGQTFKEVSNAERWIGLAVLLAGYGLRIVAAQYYSEPLSRLSFLIVLLGGFLMVGGWSFLRWTGPGLAFLIFMYPLPSIVEQTLLLNLQKLAAVMAEVVLTILNQPVVRTGSVIHVDGIPLEVAEACSGLRMVTIYGGFAVACALLIKRPWWDRLIILLSAIPIALITNIARIVVTALLYRAFPDNESIHLHVHDFAGLAMMPLALGLLYLLLKILSSLSVEEEEITGYGGGALGGASPMG